MFDGPKYAVHEIKDTRNKIAIVQVIGSEDRFILLADDDDEEVEEEEEYDDDRVEEDVKADSAPAASVNEEFFVCHDGEDD